MLKLTNPMRQNEAASVRAIAASGTVAGREPSLAPRLGPPGDHQLSLLGSASAHWDSAAAALMVRDYPTFDREMAAFKRISATWKGGR